MAASFLRHLMAMGRPYNSNTPTHPGNIVAQGTGIASNAATAAICLLGEIGVEGGGGSEGEAARGSVVHYVLLTYFALPVLIPSLWDG